jgi:HK97 gp10 family phage protein
MAGKNLTIRGVKQLEKKLGRLPRVIDEAAREAVKEQVSETGDDMRRLAPKLTRELEESVQEEIDKTGLSGTVSPRARYAAFVNDGARGIPAQPFATAAAKLARGKFRKRTETITAEALRRLGKG